MHAGRTCCKPGHRRNYTRCNVTFGDYLRLKGRLERFLLSVQSTKLSPVEDKGSYRSIPTPVLCYRYRRQTVPAISAARRSKTGICSNVFIKMYVVSIRIRALMVITLSSRSVGHFRLGQFPPWTFSPARGLSPMRTAPVSVQCCHPIALNSNRPILRHTGCSFSYSAKKL